MSLDIRNTKIRIKDEQHSVLVQKTLFELGAEWGMLDSKSPQYTEKKYLYVDSRNGLNWSDDADYFSEYGSLEIVYNSETTEFETPKTLKHKHADLIMKFAEIAQTDTKPWRHFEYFSTVLDRWLQMSQKNEMFRTDYYYRLKKAFKKIKQGIKFQTLPSLPKTTKNLLFLL